MCKNSDVSCFARPLPNLVVNFSSPPFLKDYVAVYSQEVVDAADSHTLLEEGKFRLRALAELDAFVHCSNDVCLAQEWVRDGPTATPGVVLPAVTVETLAVFCTSWILHSGGAVSRSFTK